MFNRKRLVVLILLIFILSITALPTFATGTPPVFLEAAYYCDAVVLTYTPSVYYGSYNVKVINAKGDVSIEIPLVDLTVYPPPGPITLVIPLDPTQEEGSLLKVQYENYGISWINIFAGNCSGLAPEIGADPATPAYYQFGGEDAYMGMRFVTEVEENPIVILLDISNDSEGTVMFYIAASVLEEEYPCTGETYAIFQSANNIHQFHRLDSCEFQLTTGPDFEGKTHALIFEGLPPQNIYQYTMVTIGYSDASDRPF